MAFIDFTQCDGPRVKFKINDETQCMTYHGYQDYYQASHDNNIVFIYGLLTGLMFCTLVVAIISRGYRRRLR